MADILTRGLCKEFIDEGKRVANKLYGDLYCKHSWSEDLKLDLLGLYISDSGFSVLTTKEKAKELEIEFKTFEEVV